MSVHLSTGSNYATATVGPLSIHYSYATPVGLTINGALTVRQNEWGPTTGKHLNALDGGSADAKARRVDGETFAALLDVVTTAVAAALEAATVAR